MPPAASPAASAKAGYTLLEMLIVLAIMAVAMTIVVPRGAVMMDRVVTHAVFFDFQRQVSDLRREAYDSQTPVTLYGSGAADPADPAARTLALRSGWSYRLQRPIRIGDGGACTASAADLLKGGQVIMRLTMGDSACHFIRQD